MEPIGANVFLERIDDYDGIVKGVDWTLRERLGLRAKVVAVGPDAKDVRRGDVVIVGRASGAEVNLANRPLVVCRQEDVLAVMECG